MPNYETLAKVTVDGRTYHLRQSPRGVYLLMRGNGPRRIVHWDDLDEEIEDGLYPEEIRKAYLANEAKVIAELGELFGLKPPANGGVVVIQLARLSDWLDEDDAPTWVRATIWAATAREDELPGGKGICALCHRPHKVRPLIAAQWKWPDHAPDTCAAVCPRCSALATLPELLTDQIKQLKPDAEISVSWDGPDRIVS